MNEKTLRKTLMNKAVEFLNMDFKKHDIKIVNNEILIDNKFIIDILVYDCYNVDGYSKNHVRYFLLLNGGDNWELFQSKDFYRVCRELRKELRKTS